MAFSLRPCGRSSEFWFYLYVCFALSSLLCVILSLTQGPAQWLMCEVLSGCFCNTRHSAGHRADSRRVGTAPTLGSKAAPPTGRGSCPSALLMGITSGNPHHSAVCEVLLPPLFRRLRLKKLKSPSQGQGEEPGANLPLLDSKSKALST